MSSRRYVFVIQVLPVVMFYSIYRPAITLPELGPAMAATHRFGNTRFRPWCRQGRYGEALVEQVFPPVTQYRLHRPAITPPELVSAAACAHRFGNAFPGPFIPFHCLAILHNSVHTPRPPTPPPNFRFGSIYVLFIDFLNSRTHVFSFNFCNRKFTEAPWGGGAERGYSRNVLWEGVRGQALTRDANTYRIPPNGKSTWWNHGVLTANGQADHIGWLRSAAG